MIEKKKVETYPTGETKSVTEKDEKGFYKKTSYTRSEKIETIRGINPLGSYEEIYDVNEKLSSRIDWDDNDNIVRMSFYNETPDVFMRDIQISYNKDGTTTEKTFHDTKLVSLVNKDELGNTIPPKVQAQTLSR